MAIFTIMPAIMGAFLAGVVLSTLAIYAFLIPDDPPRRAADDGSAAPSARLRRDHSARQRRRDRHGRRKHLVGGGTGRRIGAARLEPAPDDGHGALKTVAASGHRRPRPPRARRQAPPAAAATAGLHGSGRPRKRCGSAAFAISADVSFAVLETDGRINVLRRTLRRGTPGRRESLKAGRLGGWEASRAGGSARGGLGQADQVREELIGAHVGSAGNWRQSPRPK